MGMRKYGDQNTDGSQSIRLFYDVLRNTGASMKMLIRAGAQHWSVPIDEISAENHRIHQSPQQGAWIMVTNRHGEQIARAGAGDIQAKKRSKFIGKGMLHVDTGTS